MSLRVSFLNLKSCVYCRQVELTLARDPDFKIILAENNVTWVNYELTTIEQIDDLKATIKRYYNLKVPSFPCFLIQNEDLSEPYLLVGSNSWNGLKAILRSKS